MSSPYLRCNTPGCNNTPHNITASVARGRFEYRLQHDPKYVFHLACEKCNKGTRYTYEQIIGLIPPDERPKTLPHDYFWAYILFDVGPWKRKDHHAYLGDRVLVQRLMTEPNGSWYGILKTTSAYAPTLLPGNYVKGSPRGNYELCLFSVEGEQSKPIMRPQQIPKASSFGMFLAPQDDNNALYGANIMCSNPSCNYIFSTMTFTKFSELIAQEQLNEDAFDETTFLPTLELKCPFCSTVRVIDEGSFEGLFKERE